MYICEVETHSLTNNNKSIHSSQPTTQSVSDRFTEKINHLISPQSLPASVAQWAETKCAPTGTVCRRGGVQSPGQPVDFVFRFQGRML